MSADQDFKAIGVVDFDHWQDPKEFTYHPRPMRPHDIQVKIIACGICGSDMHCAKGDWGRLYTPLAVGHEIIGHVINIGSEVDKEKFKVGDRVGIGPECECCGKCYRCKHGLESNCTSQSLTYSYIYPDGTKTQGGYADNIRVNDHFVFRIPDGLDTIHAAPLLCGGITGFRPLLDFGVKKGTKVGVSGVGGIGHMSILFAKALGAEVTAISRSDKKKEISKKLGVDHYIATSDESQLEAGKDSLDLIVNTASSFSQTHIESVMSLLKPNGKLTFITAPELKEKVEITPFFFLFNNYSIGGSAAGSVKQIEYMLKLAAEKHIEPWVETIDISEDNVKEAWRRMEEGDVKFRFVLTGYDKYFGRDK